MKTIETVELKKRIDRGDHFRLIDTLPEATYRAGHLPGAVHLSADEVGEDPDGVLPDRDESIVLYGADESCPACATIADALESMGYRDVTWFRGGKHAWEAAGHAFEGEAG